MGSDKMKSSQSTAVTEAQLTRKFHLLKKYIHNCNGRILHLKKRMHIVTREVKALKRERECHMKKVKKAERIERQLDAVKTKMKRKVLKAGAAPRSKEGGKKDMSLTSVTSVH